MLKKWLSGVIICLTFLWSINAMAFWTPQPGPQAKAATCPVDFPFFGGTRGGGKSDCLIGRQMRGAEKYEHHWNGLIVRRKYKDFLEIRLRIDGMIRAGLPAVRIGGEAQPNYVRFKNGARWVMVAIHRLDMVDDFIGHQYCVAEDTPIIMGDGSLKHIQDVYPGDMVMTLEGPKKVLRRMPARNDYCVQAVTPFGSQIHPIKHPIFSIFGWQSYASILDAYSITTEEILQGSSQPPVVNVPAVLYMPHQHQSQQFGPISSQSDGKYRYDSQCLERLRDLLPGSKDCKPPYEPYQRFRDHTVSRLFADDISCEQFGLQTVPSFLVNYSPYHHLHGEQPQLLTKSDQGDIPSQGDAALPSLSSYMLDVLDNIQERIPVGVSRYEHPYSGEVRKVTEENAFFPCVFSFHGLTKVYDLTIQDANHYISGDSFLVNKNTEISIDECTTFPFFTKMVDKLKGSNRSPHGVPCHMFGTGNPGGPGHMAVKGYFKLGTQYGVKPETVLYDENGESKIYIPSFLDDNRILCEADPKYVMRLKSITDPVLRKAWLLGDWDVFIGQAFVIREDVHIIDPIWPIPANAKIYTTFDWGFGAPFSWGWWWVDADGRVYRFAEWYGWNGTENEGLRLEDSRIAEGILKREKDMGINNRKIIRLASPDCFSKKPNYLGGGQGTPTSEVFAHKGIYLTPADHRRDLKIRQLRERLKFNITETGILTERPMMLIYNTCGQFRRTMPALSIDSDNPEDVDTEQEDHIYDEVCEICMARPMKLKHDKPQRTMAEMHIDVITRQNAQIAATEHHFRDRIDENWMFEQAMRGMTTGAVEFPAEYTIPTVDD